MYGRCRNTSKSQRNPIEQFAARSQLRSFSIALVSLVVCSCTKSEVSDFAVLSAQPTPVNWSRPATWDFEIVGKHREPLGKFTLYFSDEAVETCTAGKWKRAYLKNWAFSTSPLQAWDATYFHPAYEISGRNLLIQLSAGCDVGAEGRGSLSDSGARGVLAEVDLFHGRELGTFNATMNVQK